MLAVTLSDILTTPVFSLTQDHSVSEAITMMHYNGISAVLIVDHDFPIGIFTESDALGVTYRHQNTDQLRLKQWVNQDLVTASPEMDYQEGYALINERGLQHLVVVDNAGKLLGIISEDNFLKNMGEEYLLSYKTVSSSMSSNVVTVDIKSHIDDVVELMFIKSLSCVVVVKKNAPVGMFSKRDLIQLHSGKQDIAGDTVISSIMTKPLITVAADESLARAIVMMDKEDVRRLVVIDQQGDLDGLLTRHDVVKQIQDHQIEYLKNKLLQQDRLLTDANRELELAKQLARSMRDLNESEIRYHQLFQNIDVGIAIYQALDEGKDFKFIDHNTSGERIIGIPNEELLGQSIKKMCPNIEQTGLIEVFQRVYQSGVPEQHAETQYSDQRISLWVENYVYKLPNGYIVALYRDITDRKLAEIALKESNAQYEAYFQHANNCIFVVDAAGEKILDVNPKASQVLEYTRDEFLTIPVAEIHLDEMEILQAFVDEVMSQGHSVTNELNCRTKSGKTIPANITGARIPYAGSESIIAVVQDLSDLKRVEMDLARADIEWTQAMDEFDDVVYLLDTSRHLVRANSAFYKMIGARPEDCVGKYIVDLIHPELDETECPMCLAQKMMKEITIFSQPGDQHNPSNKPLEAHLKLVKGESGCVTGLLVSYHDLSQQLETDEHNRLSSSVLDNTTEGVVITDADANIVQVNHAFTKIFGYTSEEVIGKNPRILKSGRHDEIFYQNLWNSLIEKGHWMGEMWNRRKDGAIFPERKSISSVKDDTGRVTHYVAILSDITHLKQSQDKLDHLAHYDALTDLPNRLLLNERLEHAITVADRHDSELTLLFLDLDNFKHINDSIGHPLGDKLLQSVARRLTETFRENDTIARLGGDEFVLLLEGVNQIENALISAQKTLSVFKTPYLLDQHEVSITASVGVSVYPRDGREPATLLRNADAASYRAKDRGKNNYQFYTEEMTHMAYERVLMENHLRQAINNDELDLHYQPQLSLKSQRVVGLEALARWTHPELGKISPARFIPLAEESGLIHDIGEWVLKTACKQAKKWLDQGVFFGRIAVNIAGSQIQRGTLVGDVILALAESGLSAQHLELEVTEGFIMQQPESAIKQLNELKNLGLILAIDDFGTGYSSLSYLKKLPIQKLKIDQSFVQEIPQDSNDMAITNAIIAMAKSLDMSVIAEGTETAEQVEFLRNAGCDEVQGYYYSQPLPVDKIENYLKKPV